MVGSAEQLPWEGGQLAPRSGHWWARRPSPHAATAPSEEAPTAWLEQGSPRGAGAAPGSLAPWAGADRQHGGAMERVPVASGRLSGDCQQAWDTS